MKLRIGCEGSCADIGVVAESDIPGGVVLARIPRSALLNAGNSTSVARALKQDKLFQRGLSSLNSWVPLLLTLLAEKQLQVLRILELKFLNIYLYYFIFRVSRAQVFGGHIFLSYRVRCALDQLTNGHVKRENDYCRGREWGRGWRVIWWTWSETLTV